MTDPSPTSKLNIEELPKQTHPARQELARQFTQLLQKTHIEPILAGDEITCQIYAQIEAIAISTARHRLNVLAQAGLAEFRDALINNRWTKIYRIKKEP